jgi:hypothetical protein
MPCRLCAGGRWLTRVVGNAHNISFCASRSGSPSSRDVRQNGGRPAVIYATYHVVSVPAITDVHGTIASVAWIFMQTIVF